MLRHGTCSCNIQHEPGVLEFDTAATAISRKPTHKDLSLVCVLLQLSTQWDVNLLQAFQVGWWTCQSMVNVKQISFCNFPLAWSLRKDAWHNRKRAERSGETLVGKTARKTLRKPAAVRVSPVKKLFTKEDTLSSGSEKSMVKWTQRVTQCFRCLRKLLAKGPRLVQNLSWK